MLDSVLQALQKQRKLMLENFLLTFRHLKLSACRAHWQVATSRHVKGTSQITDINNTGYFFIASFYPKVALSTKIVF